MEIVEITEKDYLESLKLSMYAFQYRVPEENIPARKEMLKNHQIIGIWEQANLAAKLHILPHQINMNRFKWKMGGIAGVATYPEFRRKGYVRALIIDALKRMYENEQIVSLLHPFDIGFYRKFGWEIFTENKEIHIEQKDLKFLNNQPGTVKRFTKDQHHPDIESVYHEFSKKYMGMLVRDRTWWKNNIYGDGQIAVYYNEGNEAKGYILYQLNERKMEVQEFISLNHEARCGLWNFICQHDSMIERISLLTSLHENLPFVLQQPKVKMEITPYFMARLVDVEQCLKTYEFHHHTERVYLHIEDEFAPWNNGSYLVGKGEVKVFKEKKGSSCVHPPKKGIRLDINSLTAILFGYKRPAELYEMGYLMGLEDEVAEFERIVPRHKPYFYDFF